MPAAYIFSMRKAPDSELFYEVDFRSEDPTEQSARLDADETLTGSNITVDDPGLVVSSAQFLAGGKALRVFVEGGDSGVAYHVTVDVDTSGSDLKSFPERELSRTFEVVVV